MQREEVRAKNLKSTKTAITFAAVLAQEEMVFKGPKPKQPILWFVEKSSWLAHLTLQQQRRKVDAKSFFVKEFLEERRPRLKGHSSAALIVDFGVVRVDIVSIALFGFVDNHSTT